MGGKPRTPLHTECACCQDPLKLDRAYDPGIPLLTQRRIGLCQQCLEGDCYCEDVDEMHDAIMELEDEYGDKIADIKKRIKTLEEAKERGKLFLLARTP